MGWQHPQRGAAKLDTGGASTPGQLTLALACISGIALSDRAWYCILGERPMSPRTTTATEGCKYQCIRSDIQSAEEGIGNDVARQDRHVMPTIFDADFFFRRRPMPIMPVAQRITHTTDCKCRCKRSSVNLLWPIVSVRRCRGVERRARRADCGTLVDFHEACPSLLPWLESYAPVVVCLSQVPLCWLQNCTVVMALLRDHRMGGHTLH